MTGDAAAMSLRMPLAMLALVADSRAFGAGPAAPAGLAGGRGCHFARRARFSGGSAFVRRSCPASAGAPSATAPAAPRAFGQDHLDRLAVLAQHDFGLDDRQVFLFLGGRSDSGKRRLAHGSEEFRRGCRFAQLRHH